jgi:hypothetical protein
VRIVGRPVDRIKQPSTWRPTVVGAHPHLFPQHGVLRKAAGNQAAKARFDGDVNLGDEINQTLLSDVKSAAGMVGLYPTSLDDSFDGGGEKKRGL